MVDNSIAGLRQHNRCGGSFRTGWYRLARSLPRDIIGSYYLRKTHLNRLFHSLNLYEDKHRTKFKSPSNVMSQNETPTPYRGDLTEKKKKNPVSGGGPYELSTRRGHREVHIGKALVRWSHMIERSAPLLWNSLLELGSGVAQCTFVRVNGC